MLAGGLRFSTLDVQGFWFDESVTVGLVEMGFGDMLRAIPASESTPPLYYVLAWLWTGVFGTGEVGLRSLSALFGTTLVPVAWAAGRELSTRWTGLAVATLAAVSPFLFWYSQEARAYSLLTLLCGLSLWLLARLRDDPSRRDVAAWALVCALALATHYFAVFLVAGEAVCLLALHRHRRSVLLGIGAVAAAGLALVPLALGQESAGFAGFIDDESLARRAAIAVKQLALGFDSPVELLSAGAAVAVLAIGALIGTVRPDPPGTRGVRIAAGLGLAAVALPAALALAGTDYVLTRNLLPAWLPLAVVAAAGLTSRMAGRAGTLALALVLALSLASTVGISLEPAWQREDWRGAAQRIGQAAPRAILVTEATHARPVRLYRPTASTRVEGPQRVTEVVALARRGRNLGDSVPTPPAPRTLEALGLRVAESRRTPTYELIRMVPTAGVAELNPEQLQSLRLAAERGPAGLLVER